MLITIISDYIALHYYIIKDFDVADKHRIKMHAVLVIELNILLHATKISFLKYNNLQDCKIFCVTTVFFLVEGSLYFKDHRQLDSSMKVAGAR